MIAIPTLAIALVAARSGPTPSPGPIETPTPIVTPLATESPAAVPTIEPGAPTTVQPVATPTSTPVVPTATPAFGRATQTTPPESYAYRFVPRQPAHVDPGMPQIFAVYLNSKTLKSLGPILIKVTTDPGTVKVTSRSGGREGTIPLVVPGDFEANAKLPKLPFIASGMTLDLEFTAVSADGRRTTVKVPVALR